MAKYVIFGITWGYSQDKKGTSLKPAKFQLRNFDFEAQPIYIVPNKRRIKKITEGNSTYHISVMDRKVMLISKRDDHEIAQRIAESFLLCWGVFNESVLFGQYVEAYPVDEKFVVDNEFVLREAFGNNYDMLNIMIHRHPTIFKSYWNKIWSMVEATIDEDIFEALRFYSESLNAYTVDKMKLFDGDLDSEQYPENFRDRSEVEVAIVACCKAIEQLFGEPSSNKMKYKRKLIQKGVDPDEYVGYKGKEKIINKIYKFHNEIRNKKAAHGKTLPPAKRKISFLELLDLQTLTNYLIWKVIMHTLNPNYAVS